MTKIMIYLYHNGSIMDDESYKQFLTDNQAEMNVLLNKILWVLVCIGPLIALGILLHWFYAISIISCFILTAATLAVAVIHSVEIKRHPASILAKYISLLTLEVLVVYMSLSHISIYLTFFVVPLISLLYCEPKTYNITSAVCYLVMIGATYQIAPFKASSRIGVTAFGWFASRAGGYTIEYIIMYTSGFALIQTLSRHLLKEYGDTLIIKRKERESCTDSLTGLWNKRYLEKYFSQYENKKHGLIAFIIFDMDNFKAVNDTYGHSEGDRALIDFSTLLTLSFRKEDNPVICRYGGDEFIAILPHLKRREELGPCLDRLTSIFRTHFPKDEHFKDITVSMGATFVTGNGESFKSIFDKADSALYHVKRDTKNGWRIYGETDEK